VRETLVTSQYKSEWIGGLIKGRIEIKVNLPQSNADRNGSGVDFDKDFILIPIKLTRNSYNGLFCAVNTAPCFFKLLKSDV
jgi:hypothetical protein